MDLDHGLRFRVSIALVVTFVLAGFVPMVATGSSQAAADSPTYEVFTGSVDDFYHVPEPFASGAPGELIRVQPVSSTDDATTLRIMYHSVDGAGRDRAVTGTLTYPNRTAPQGGWPVMSIANGTVGLVSSCAPSRAGRPGYGFGTGGVVVDSDYIGSGPVGEIQAYLSRDSEGHSVIDAVRAARNYHAAQAGTQFLVLGGSQGGHGALAANELAAGYAPELDLLGTVALAPAAMFDRTYGPLDEIVTKVVMAMGILGLSTEHADIAISDYIGPNAMAAVDVLRTQCSDADISAVLGVVGDLFTHDPRTTEPARSIMLANDVGHVAAPSPVLLVQGTADPIVNPLRTDDLFARMCGAGQVTEYVTVPGADHDTVTGMAIDTIEGWLGDRLAGVSASSDCPRAPSSTTIPEDTIPADTSSTTVPEDTIPADTSSTTSSTIPAATTPTTSVLQPVATSGGSVDQPRQAGPAGTTQPTNRSGELPRTGAPLEPLTLVALACLGAGVVIIAATRRRFNRLQ